MDGVCVVLSVKDEYSRKSSIVHIYDEMINHEKSSLREIEIERA